MGRKQKVVHNIVSLVGDETGREKDFVAAYRFRRR